MSQGNGTIVLLLIVAALILLMMGTATALLRGRRLRQRVSESGPTDPYDRFVSDSRLVTRLNQSRLTHRIGGLNDRKYDDLRALFDRAKNPWGITPTIYRFIRITVSVAGFGSGLFCVLLFESYRIALVLFLIGFLGWWYPSYYYKAIAKEREQEWDKIYEFIWLIKNTSMLYDAKKVCLETRDYINKHYPHHKELIQGFTDFHEHWDDNGIPEYIRRHYDFTVPKELYTILYNMNITGTPPNQGLDNLRAFALNRHNHRIQSVLSGVPSKATLGTLPFLMLSVVIALLIPMIQTFIRLM